MLFGEEVYCLGAEKINQVSKIQGTSVKYCYGDEIAKWAQEVFIMVQASLDKTYSCFDGALNPENQSHWFKKDFLDVIEEKGLDVYVQNYTIFDNPFLSKEFVDNLCSININILECKFFCSLLKVFNFFFININMLKSKVRKFELKIQAKQYTVK